MWGEASPALFRVSIVQVRLSAPPWAKLVGSGDRPRKNRAVWPYQGARGTRSHLSGRWKAGVDTARVRYYLAIATAAVRPNRVAHRCIPGRLEDACHRGQRHRLGNHSSSAAAHSFSRSPVSDKRAIPPGPWPASNYGYHNLIVAKQSDKERTTVACWIIPSIPLHRNWLVKKIRPTRA